MNTFECGDELDSYTADLERRTKEDQALTQKHFEEMEIKQAECEYLKIVTGQDTNNRIH